MYNIENVFNAFEIINFLTDNKILFSTISFNTHIKVDEKRLK